MLVITSYGTPISRSQDVPILFASSSLIPKRRVSGYSRVDSQNPR